MSILVQILVSILVLVLILILVSTFLKCWRQASSSPPGSVGASLTLATCQPILVLLFVGADCWLMMFLMVVGGYFW